MISELSEIKEMRKKFGLTQSELAKRANVSQSLIAKIESGRIDPTYTNVKKILAALNDLGKKSQLKAKDVMSSKMISVRPDETITEAIKKMKKLGISQMPVIDEHRSIGLVSESIILDSIGKNVKRIEEIMDDAPPIISEKTTIDVVASLLRFAPLILVSENGKLKGVITKSDVLAKAYR